MSIIYNGDEFMSITEFKIDSVSDDNQQIQHNYIKDSHRFNKWKRINNDFISSFRNSTYNLSDRFFNPLPDYHFSQRYKELLKIRSRKNLNYLSNCSDYLKFSKSSDNDLVLTEAYFCRSRFCTLCNWRRRLKLGHRFYSYFSENYQDYQLVFLTLTLPNCHLAHLRQNLDILGLAYKYLFGLTNKVSPYYRKVGGFLGQYSGLKSLGSFRNFEITRKFTSLSPELTDDQGNYYLKDKSLPPFFYSYHPHIHAIVMFPKGSNYVSHDQFYTQCHNNYVSAWAKSLLKAGLNYPLFERGLETGNPQHLPSLRVRLISDGINFDSDSQNLDNSDILYSIKNNIYESCKYGFDIHKFINNDNDYFIEKNFPGAIDMHLSLLSNFLYNYRMLSTYGLLRKIKLVDDINNNTDNLLNLYDVQSTENFNHEFRFNWNNLLRDFVLESNLSKPIY